MCEKFLHAFLTALFFKIHIDQEISSILVAIRTSQKHLDIINCTKVTFTYINNKAGIFILNQCNLVVRSFRLESHIGLRDYKFFLIDVGRYFYSGVRCCFVYCCVDRIYDTGYRSAGIFVYKYFSLKCVGEYKSTTNIWLLLHGWSRSVHAFLLITRLEGTHAVCIWHLL
jgi:hypothetical protein